ncbi:hypothetical protein EVG20_g11397 [Dentipellis fragilis]|uniref:Uncharacterized protein n=1 Tax=Dentipellis fragilis TaxID=205917 RepID=A0A4Y9XN86_9AGAM|nr:hypothetical protein EVG20_g11397 [Dentipellis fragilis]
MSLIRKTPPTTLKFAFEMPSPSPQITPTNRTTSGSTDRTRGGSCARDRLKTQSRRCERPVSLARTSVADGQYVDLLNVDLRLLTSIAACLFAVFGQGVPHERAHFGLEHVEPCLILAAPRAPPSCACPGIRAVSRDGYTCSPAGIVQPHAERSPSLILNSTRKRCATLKARLIRIYPTLTRTRHRLLRASHAQLLAVRRRHRRQRRSAWRPPHFPIPLARHLANGRLMKTMRFPRIKDAGSSRLFSLAIVSHAANSTPRFSQPSMLARRQPTAARGHKHCSEPRHAAVPATLASGMPVHGPLQDGPARCPWTPDTGPSMSLAVGDACSRAVNLAYLLDKGDKSLPSALTASRLSSHAKSTWSSSWACSSMSRPLSGWSPRVQLMTMLHEDEAIVRWRDVHVYGALACPPFPARHHAVPDQDPLGEAPGEAEEATHLIISLAAAPPQLHHCLAHERHRHEHHTVDRCPHLQGVANTRRHCRFLRCVIDPSAQAICAILHTSQPPRPSSRRWETRKTCKMCRIKDTDRNGGFGGLLSLKFASPAASRALFDTLP